MARESIARWLIPVAVTLALAGLGGIAWATTTAATLGEQVKSAAAKAHEAHTLATKDHDTVVRLDALLPRLEKAVDRLEGKDPDKKGAVK